MHRDDTEAFALGEVKRCEFRLTKPGRIRQDGLEHGREIAGRPADDPEHFRARSLLLDRLIPLLRKLRNFPVCGGSRGRRAPRSYGLRAAFALSCRAAARPHGSIESPLLGASLVAIAGSQSS